MSNIIGPDVSFYDDDNNTARGIDFARMKSAGASFVYIKVGQKDYSDQDFRTNWPAAKTAGLPRGSFWFYDNSADPVEQAEKFASLLGWDLGELPLMVDLETSPPGSFGGWRNWKKCLIRLQQLVGAHEIGIYTRKSFWDAQNIPMEEQTFFAQFCLWIAHYGVATPAWPDVWGQWTFWQFMDRADGAKYGVESHDLDMNYFAGDIAAFFARFRLNAPMPPPVVSPPVQEKLFDGAIYSKVIGPRGIHYHVIELDTSKFEFFVSPKLLSRKYVPSFLTAFNLDIAINGDGFVSTTIKGFAASRGAPYGSMGVEETVYISQDNHFQVTRPQRLWNAISHPNRLVVDGQVVHINKSPLDYRARTAWGWSQDQKRVYFFVCDGEDYSANKGMSFQEVAGVMRELGCWMAFMQDGGGSSTMAVKPNRVLNIPNGEDLVPGFLYPMRRVANTLGVRRKQ